MTPWGKRRNPDGSDDTAGSITSQTTRGFTGKEELSVSGLVHLNGWVYDPLLARMTSADPTVADLLNGHGWNRHSYVGNDPLAFTDPNGFSGLSSAFHAVADFLTHNPGRARDRADRRHHRARRHSRAYWDTRFHQTNPVRIGSAGARYFGKFPCYDVEIPCSEG